MVQLQYLTLRSCGFTGQIPEYIGSLLNLKRLDLSYNLLSGSFPSNFYNLLHTNFIFLTSNGLSGSVPDWMFSGKNNIDLSYNNFTLVGQAQTCQQENVNLLGSSYRYNNQSASVPCLESIPCSGKRWSLYINCGGDTVTSDDNHIYEQDSDVSNGVASFRVGTNWAVSSTGSFMDSRDINNFIATATQTLSMQDSQLYKNARISPLSFLFWALFDEWELQC
ncbi:putative LRR receptor-like serine/threonine-protein kinase [Apostasia shenzhenica]|uniref:Putative LRR receptor-like serine/threonine-protein kinase n=1 Tax=Apostasia shenzhenica TaxID=1088818 RepID=A0A2I0AMY4_9ASPA|nr:putative LRR receptor-like serine/threonine-protein kinase [Apostasia shenzhenica]